MERERKSARELFGKLKPAMREAASAAGGVLKPAVRDAVSAAGEVLKPAVRDAATAAGDAGKAKVNEYALRATNASKEIMAETSELSGDARKREVKALFLQRIGMPFPVRMGVAPLIERAVDIAVDFEDVRGCLCQSATPERRREAGAIILKRLNAPVYLRWAAKPVVGRVLDVAAEYAHLLDFGVAARAFSKPDAADTALCAHVPEGAGEASSLGEPFHMEEGEHAPD